MIASRLAQAAFPALAALLASGPALASELRELTGDSRCPSPELVERELLPLLDRTALDFVPSLAVRIDDLGESYRISVGDARREVRDPARDCAERAKVSAVFIALNLPRKHAPQSPQRESSDAALPRAETEIIRPRLLLQLIGSVEHAPELGRVGSGLSFGAAARGRNWGVTLSAGVLTPLSIVPEDHERAAYELWRLPGALMVGYGADGPALGASLEGGLALDVLRFRGLALPNPDEGVRFNPGIRVTLTLRLRASRQLSAVLVPTFAYFPRTYLIRLEPTHLLGESPRFWLGAGIGLESSILGG